MAALLASVAAGLWGGALREFALAPWVFLTVLALGDVVLSLSRRKSVTASLTPEIFLGETAELSLSVAPAPPGLIVRFDWPDGLSGPAECRFAGGAASVTCRAVRRGVWRLTRL
ncbi:MAG: DUF58 domain-containing protein, partial [Tabrizicola sp.]